MTQSKTATVTDTAPESIDETILKYLHEQDQEATDGVPVSPADDTPTAPIKFGTALGEPPAVPSADASPATIELVTDRDETVTVSEADDFDMSDFDDEEVTKVPTGDE